MVKYKNFGGGRDRATGNSTAMTETSEGNCSSSHNTSGYNKGSKTSSSYHTTGSFSFNSYVNNTTNNTKQQYNPKNTTRQQPPQYASAEVISALESRDEEDATTTASTRDDLQIYSQTSSTIREAEEDIASLYDMISYNGSKLVMSQNSTTTTTTDDDDEDGTASDTALVGRTYSSYEECSEAGTTPAVFSTTLGAPTIVLSPKAQIAAAIPTISAPPRTPINPAAQQMERSAIQLIQNLDDESRIAAAITPAAMRTSQFTYPTTAGETTTTRQGGVSLTRTKNATTAALTISTRPEAIPEVDLDPRLSDEVEEDDDISSQGTSTAAVTTMSPAATCTATVMSTSTPYSLSAQQRHEERSMLLQLEAERQRVRQQHLQPQQQQQPPSRLWSSNEQLRAITEIGSHQGRGGAGKVATKAKQTRDSSTPTSSTGMRSAAYYSSTTDNKKLQHYHMHVLSPIHDAPATPPFSARRPVVATRSSSAAAPPQSEDYSYIDKVKMAQKLKKKKGTRSVAKQQQQHQQEQQQYPNQRYTDSSSVPYADGHEEGRGYGYHQHYGYQDDEPHHPLPDGRSSNGGFVPRIPALAEQLHAFHKYHHLYPDQQQAELMIVGPDGRPSLQNGKGLVAKTVTIDPASLHVGNNTSTSTRRTGNGLTTGSTELLASSYSSEFYHDYEDDLSSSSYLSSSNHARLYQEHGGGLCGGGPSNCFVTTCQAILNPRVRDTTSSIDKFGRRRNKSKSNISSSSDSPLMRRTKPSKQRKISTDILPSEPPQRKQQQSKHNKNKLKVRMNDPKNLNEDNDINWKRIKTTEIVPPKELVNNSLAGGAKNIPEEPLVDSFAGGVTKLFQSAGTSIMNTLPKDIQQLTTLSPTYNDVFDSFRASNDTLEPKVAKEEKEDQKNDNIIVANREALNDDVNELDQLVHQTQNIDDEAAGTTGEEVEVRDDETENQSISSNPKVELFKKFRQRRHRRHETSPSQSPPICFSRSAPTPDPQGGVLSPRERERIVESSYNTSKFQHKYRRNMISKKLVDDGPISSCSGYDEQKYRSNAKMKKESEKDRNTTSVKDIDNQDDIDISRDATEEAYQTCHSRSELHQNLSDPPGDGQNLDEEIKAFFSFGMSHDDDFASVQQIQSAESPVNDSDNGDAFASVHQIQSKEATKNIENFDNKSVSSKTFPGRSSDEDDDDFASVHQIPSDPPGDSESLDTDIGPATSTGIEHVLHSAFNKFVSLITFPSLSNDEDDGDFASVHQLHSDPPGDSGNLDADIGPDTSTGTEDMLPPAFSGLSDDVDFESVKQIESTDPPGNSENLDDLDEDIALSTSTGTGMSESLVGSDEDENSLRLLECNMIASTSDEDNSNETPAEDGDDKNEIGIITKRVLIESFEHNNFPSSHLEVIHEGSAEEGTGRDSRMISVTESDDFSINDFFSVVSNDGTKSNDRQDGGDGGRYNSISSGQSSNPLSDQDFASMYEDSISNEVRRPFFSVHGLLKSFFVFGLMIQCGIMLNLRDRAFNYVIRMDRGPNVLSKLDDFVSDCKSNGVLLISSVNDIVNITNIEKTISDIKSNIKSLRGTGSYLTMASEFSKAESNGKDVVSRIWSVVKDLARIDEIELSYFRRTKQKTDNEEDGSSKLEQRRKAYQGLSSMNLDELEEFLKEQELFLLIDKNDATNIKEKDNNESSDKSQQKEAISSMNLDELEAFMEEQDLLQSIPKPRSTANDKELEVVHQLTDDVLERKDDEEVEPVSISADSISNETEQYKMKGVYIV